MKEGNGREAPRHRLWPNGREGRARQNRQKVVQRPSRQGVEQSRPAAQRTPRERLRCRVVPEKRLRRQRPLADTDGVPKLVVDVRDPAGERLGGCTRSREVDELRGPESPSRTTKHVVGSSATASKSAPHSLVEEASVT